MPDSSDLNNPRSCATGPSPSGFLVRRPLLAYQFLSGFCPRNRWIPVTKINYTQDSCGNRFRDGRELVHLFWKLATGARSCEPFLVAKTSTLASPGSIPLTAPFLCLSCVETSNALSPGLQMVTCGRVEAPRRRHLLLQQPPPLRAQGLGGLAAGASLRPVQCPAPSNL